MGLLSCFRYIAAYLAYVLEVEPPNAKSRVEGSSSGSSNKQKQISHVFSGLIKKEGLIGLVALVCLAQVCLSVIYLL